MSSRYKYLSTKRFLYNFVDPVPDPTVPVEFKHHAEGLNSHLSAIGIVKKKKEKKAIIFPRRQPGKSCEKRS